MAGRPTAARTLIHRGLAVALGVALAVGLWIAIGVATQSVGVSDPRTLLADAPAFPRTFTFPGGTEDWAPSSSREDLPGTQRLWCGRSTESSPPCPIGQMVQKHANSLSAWWAFRAERPFSNAGRVPLEVSLSLMADDERLWCHLAEGGPREVCQLWGWSARYGQYTVVVTLDRITPDLRGVSFETFAAVVRAVVEEVELVLAGVE